MLDNFFRAAYLRLYTSNFFAIGDRRALFFILSLNLHNAFFHTPNDTGLSGVVSMNFFASGKFRSLQTVEAGRVL